MLSGVNSSISAMSAMNFAAPDLIKMQIATILNVSASTKSDESISEGISEVNSLWIFSSFYIGDSTWMI